MKQINKNLIKITDLLSDVSDDRYHNSISISKRLNISHSTVYKNMNKLKNYQIPLSLKKNKGYRLNSPLILLNHEKIKNKLDDESINLHILEKIDSTNDYLKKFTDKNNKIHVCIAETQTQGKGRLCREWHSPFGQNIYFSMLYPFKIDISELSGLSLVISLAICHTIESVIDLKNNNLQVKWPNDIILNHAKIAGILIEAQAETNGTSQIIIGIGININMQNVSANEITQMWTSLYHATHTYHDRNILCAALINQLTKYINIFLKKKLPAFSKEWKKRDALLNKKITLKTGSKTEEGTYLGINENGYLILELENKVIKTFSSGDTTLLK
ncbi:MAG: Bifunctional ligase/repressor BirA [Legionellaceae bacterium]